MKTTAPDLSKLMKLVTDPSELAHYRIPTAQGAVVTSLAARMWPYKFVSRILEDLLTTSDLRGSFNLQTLTPAQSLRPSSTKEDTWTVRTPRGDIAARRVVLATNAYTSHLLPEFADLIVPCRGQMSALEPLPSVAGDENRLKTSVGFLGDGLDDYLIQRPSERGGHLMFGGGRQHGPSIGVTDDSVMDDETAKYLRSRLVEALGLPEGKGGRDGEACKILGETEVRILIILRVMIEEHDDTDCFLFQQQHHHTAASRPSPAAEFRAVNEWTGIMGFSRDERPWIGPVPNKPGVFLSAGYTGHGMPNTWLCGKAAAIMVRLSLLPSDHASVVDMAAMVTGLPKAYRLTEERMRRALGAEEVEAKDWAEMERGSDRREERPHSGYA